MRIDHEASAERVHEKLKYGRNFAYRRPLIDAMLIKFGISPVLNDAINFCGTSLPSAKECLFHGSKNRPFYVQVPRHIIMYNHTNIWYTGKQFLAVH